MRKRALRIKKAVTAILFFSMVAAGCGSGNNIGSLQIKGEKNGGQKKTVLTLFLPLDGASDAARVYKDAIADYNKTKKDVEIRVDGISTGDGFNEALEQRLKEGGGGADMFVVNADSVKKLNAEGFFCDLSQLPACDMMLDSAKDQAVVNGTVYTIPIQMTAYGVYVNLDILNKFGLDVPKNRKEFLDCCQVLKEGGVTPISLNRWYALTAFTMAGGLYRIYQSPDKDSILAGLNDGTVKIGDYMLEGFQLFEEMVEKGYYGDGITAEETDKRKAGNEDREDFAAGKTAFYVLTLGNEKQLTKICKDNISFTVQPLPVLPEGSISLPAISARLSVNAKGEHLEEALDAVEYMTAIKADELAEDGSGFLPALKGNEEIKVDSRSEMLYEKMISPGQVPIEDMSLYFDYWGTVRKLCLKIIDGMSPEEAALEYNRIQMEQISQHR